MRVRVGLQSVVRALETLLWSGLLSACGQVHIELLDLADAARGPQPSDPAPPVDASSAALDAATLLDATSRLDAWADAAEAPEAALCAGTSALDLCWYLGAPGKNCNETCEPHGGFDARSLPVIGISSQGGSFDECAEVMAALGQERPTYGYRHDGVSTGCHVFPDGGSWWLDDPSLPFAPANRYGAVRIACACAR